MNFFSIREFFYKLNTLGFILLLLPLGAFIFLHFQSDDSIVVVLDQQETITLLLVCIGVFAFDLTIVHLLWNSRLRKMRTMLELAEKMDGYFWLVLVRGAAYMGTGLLMAVGFFLSRSILFTGEFLFILVVLVVQWPTPAGFCRHLQLKGSEQDMVMNDRDLPRGRVKKNPPIRRSVETPSKD